MNSASEGWLCAFPSSSSLQRSNSDLGGRGGLEEASAVISSARPLSPIPRKSREPWGILKLLERTLSPAKIYPPKCAGSDRRAYADLPPSRTQGAASCQIMTGEGD